MKDRSLTLAEIDRLETTPDGLIPVIAQDSRSREVLMFAWATPEALRLSLETGTMHFWSRSRQDLWRKGETSGNTLSLVSLHGDCDGDSVLARVEPAGPACHTNERSCFGATGSAGALGRLDRTVEERQRERPEGSYTVRLLDDPNLRIKKIGEETAEILAALSRGEAAGSVQEAADLLYHLVVALRAGGVTTAAVEAALDERAS